MKNLAELWAFQKEDLELDAFQAKIKDTPTRKRLVQLQSYLKSSQKKVTDIEKKAILTQNAIEEYERQYIKAGEDLEELNKDIGYMTETDAAELHKDEVQDTVKAAEKLSSDVASIRKELINIQKDIEKSDAEVRELLQKMRVAKKEYDTLRVEYDTQVAASADEVKALEKKVKAASKKLDAAVLKEYTRIKDARQNPVALFENDRCMGCNMQLPSSVGDRILSSEKPILCENCGRILIVLDDAQK